jgi:hypothetical protein
MQWRVSPLYPMPGYVLRKTGSGLADIMFTLHGRTHGAIVLTRKLAATGDAAAHAKFWARRGSSYSFLTA